MAKKKTETKKTNDFDFESCLKNLEIPKPLKEGFKYYIITNNITVKSENDLTQLLNKFKEMNAGV